MDTPESLPRSLWHYLPKKGDFVGHYLRRFLAKGSAIQMTDVAEQPILKLDREEALYFLPLKDQNVPLEFLEAGVPIDLVYCFKASASEKECKPVVRPADIVALSCDAATSTSCRAILRIANAAENELARLAPADSVRMFLRGRTP